jgi:hypothetical protein
MIDGAILPRYWDRSKHADTTTHTTVRWFAKEGHARQFAERVRRSSPTRKGFTRSTRVVRKVIGVHGFNCEFWVVTNRVRATR